MGSNTVNFTLRFEEMNIWKKQCLYNSNDSFLRIMKYIHREQIEKIESCCYFAIVKRKKCYDAFALTWIKRTFALSSTVRK
jgi:hypothetical protein